MVLAAIAAALAVWAMPQTQTALAYDEALRCAGLTQAASELEGGETRYGRSLADAALYWTLFAMQSAQADGRSPTQAEADQVRARLASVRRLTRGDSNARKQLQQCRQKTPQMG